MIYLTDVSRYVVPESCSARDALAQLERNEHKFLLIVREGGQLLATMTDGDVRRYLLRANDLDAPVAAIGNPHPRTIVERSRDLAWQMMEDEGLEFVPVVNAAGRLEGVFVALFETERVSGAVALVMAGGEGRRLRPLTETVPKPLIEVGGKPMIERIVEQLVRSGFSRIHVSVRYLSEQIVEFLRDGSRFGAEINYIKEDEPLGTLGCLSLVQFDESVDDCLVVNGDIVTDLDFKRLYQFHKVTDAGITVAVRRETYEIPFGVLDVDGMEIEAVREKPKLHFHVNAGMYVVGRSTRLLLPTGQKRDATEVLDEAICRGERVRAFIFDDDWQDIGSPASLEEARRRHGRSS